MADLYKLFATAMNLPRMFLGPTVGKMRWLPQLLGDISVRTEFSEMAYPVFIKLTASFKYGSGLLLVLFI